MYPDSVDGVACFPSLPRLPPLPPPSPPLWPAFECGLQVAEAWWSNPARLGFTAHGSSRAGRNRADLLEQGVWL